MINMIIWLIVGAVIGGLFSLIVHRRRAILLINIIVGSLGALASGYLLGPMFHIPATRFISWPGLLASLGGAVVLLAVVNFFVREHTVTNAVIETQWDKVRNKIHNRWNKITEEDFEKFDRDHTQLIPVIQERYGFSRKQVEEELQDFLKAVTGK